MASTHMERPTTEHARHRELSDPRLDVGEPDRPGGMAFPGEAQYRDTWSTIERLASRWRQIDPTRFLADFCGEETAAWRDVQNLVDGVHHAAFYLGDYDQDAQVFDWFAFLQEAAAGGRLVSAAMGPSYIAPRHYHTPGWWYSTGLADGFVIEMFCCRAYGSWTRRPARERANLMSHLGLSITSEDAVHTALDRLGEGSGALERIAFVERDEMGHTYGHIRNNRTHRVVELVHQAPQGRTGGAMPGDHREGDQ